MTDSAASSSSPSPGSAGAAIPPPAQARPTSGLAVAALVLGILWLSIPAVICGHIALSKIKKSGHAIGGGGLAIAGLVLGYVGIAVALMLMLTIFAAAGPAMAAAKQKGTERNVLSLKNAASTYYVEYRRYPVESAAGGSEDAQTTSGAEIVYILLGDEGNDLNPRGIPFLSVSGMKFDDQDNLIDHWDKQFEIYLDTDGSGTVEVDGVTVNEGVAVRSAGPDGEFGTADDISTY